MESDVVVPNSIQSSNDSSNTVNVVFDLLTEVNFYDESTVRHDLVAHTGGSLSFLSRLW